MIDPLLNILTKAGELRVLCVGDLILDTFVDGQVDRISPEAPVPVLHESQTFSSAGGVGNVCNNLAAIGMHVDLVSCVGDDPAGKQLAGHLEVCCDRLELLPLPQAETTVKTRYRSNGQQMLRVDREQQLGFDQGRDDWLFSRLRSNLDAADVVLISDYAKGVLSANLIAQIIHAAKAQEIPVVVDPKRNDFAAYAGATMITPNVREFDAAVAFEKLGGLDILEDRARTLAEKHSIARVLLTRSEKGMLLISQESAVDIPGTPVDVSDVTGAGDTVVAWAAAGQAAGISETELVEVAQLAAGLSVTQSGTTAIYPWQMLLSASPGDKEPRSKRHTIETLKAHLASGENTDEARRIGFANGVFDCLHAGHIHILEKAARSCDFLIVAINSDRSARRLKGKGRPILTQDERVRILSRLPFVDAICVFDEDTPLEAIVALAPDLLVKGNDYEPSQIVGASFVESRGGEIMIVERRPGHSTSGVVDARPMNDTRKG